MAWIVVIILRLCIPLFILRSAFWGSILAIIADNLDVVVLDLLGIQDFSPYNRVDKFLDTYLYCIQGYTLLSWKNSFAKKLGIVLLLYRTIGVVLYEMVNMRALLFIFPNLFVFYYMYYLIVQKMFKKDPFLTIRSTTPVLLVLLSLKLFQEYMLHVRQFPFYDWITTNIFSQFL